MEETTICFTFQLIFLPLDLRRTPDTACYNRSNSENDDTVELSGMLISDTRSNPKGAPVVSYAPTFDSSNDHPISMGCQWINPAAVVIGKNIEATGTVDQSRAVQLGFSVNLNELDYNPFDPDDHVGGVSPSFFISAGEFRSAARRTCSAYCFRTASL